MRRVVVTGMGMVTPLGCGVETTWANALAAKSGVVAITEFQVDDLACKIAGVVPRGPKSEGKFNPDDWMEPKESRKVDPFIVFAMAAAQEAVEDSGWVPKTKDDEVATGVLIGSGIGGLIGIEEGAYTLRDRGPRRISPFFIPGRLINLASGQVSIRYGFKGPNHSVVTACSTGAHAIGDASRLIAPWRRGRHGRRRRGGGGRAAWRSPASPPARRSPPTSTTVRNWPRAPMTATGTASC